MRQISIVIPALNMGSYIKRAIDSVLGQSYPDKELIVIDGGSTDKTLEILKSYGERIKWISEKDDGQWEAINKGLKVSDGDVFCYLNADDWYEEDIFEEIVSIFRNDPKVSLVYGNCRIVSEKSEKVFFPPRKIDFKSLLRNGNLTAQPATFFRKDLLLSSGGTARFNYMMEYDINLKLLKSEKAIFLDKILANFSMHPGQKSDERNNKFITREMMAISRVHGGSFFSRLFLAYFKNYYIKELIFEIKKVYFLREIKSFVDFLFWLFGRKNEKSSPAIVKRKIIKQYAKKFAQKVFVETGTYFGDTVKAVKDVFGEIHSIELSQELADLPQKRFSRYPHIHIHQGDSAKVLPELLLINRRPILFWLDAHFSEGITVGDDEHLPLVKEIKTILEHWQPGSVILIDDARLMGKQKGYPSFEEIENIVKSYALNLEVKQELDIIRIFNQEQG